MADDKRPVIDVAVLRKYLNSIMLHLENDLGISTVEITPDDNYFWEVPLDELFDVASDEPKLVMGSTADSLEFVTGAIARGSQKSEAATLMLMHVIPLLQVICHKVRR